MRKPRVHPRPDPTEEPGPSWQTLLRQARDGLPGAAAALRTALADHPEVWEEAGDLAAYAEKAWIERIAAHDELLKACIEQKLIALRADLDGPQASPIERLLVSRIALCWLQVHHAEAVVAQNADADQRLLDLAAKRVDAVARRLNAAMITLTSVRRLMGRATGKKRVEPADVRLGVVGETPEPTVTVDPPR